MAQERLTVSKRFSLLRGDAAQVAFGRIRESNG